MTQPKVTDPTQFLSFMREDASILWIRRDAIVYFFQDAVTYKTTLKLINGDVFVVAEKCADIQTKCTIG